MDFTKFLTLFQPDKEFTGRLGAAERLWDQCTPAKQQAIVSWLEIHGAYKGRNPYFFILDFKVKQPSGEPTDYNGRALPSEPVFSAKYNGKWGMYTQTDIDLYGLEKAPV